MHTHVSCISVGDISHPIILTEATIAIADRVPCQFVNLLVELFSGVQFNPFYLLKDTIHIYDFQPINKPTDNAKKEKYYQQRPNNNYKAKSPYK